MMQEDLRTARSTSEDDWSLVEGSPRIPQQGAFAAPEEGDLALLARAPSQAVLSDDEGDRAADIPAWSEDASAYQNTSACCLRSDAGFEEAALPSAPDATTLANKGQAAVTTAPSSPAVVLNPLYDDLDIAALDIAALGDPNTVDANHQEALAAHLPLSSCSDLSSDSDDSLPSMVQEDTASASESDDSLPHLIESDCDDGNSLPLLIDGDIDGLSDSASFSQAASFVEHEDYHPTTPHNPSDSSSYPLNDSMATQALVGGSGEQGLEISEGEISEEDEEEAEDSAETARMDAQYEKDLREALRMRAPSVAPSTVRRSQTHKYLVVGSRNVGKSTFIECLSQTIPGTKAAKWEEDGYYSNPFIGPGYKFYSRSALVASSSIQLRDPQTQWDHTFIFQELNEYDANEFTGRGNFGKLAAQHIEACQEGYYRSMKAKQAQSHAFFFSSKDSRVDAVIWLIQPHAFSAQEARELVLLSRQVVVIPVMAKADTLLPKEREERRDFVHKQLERARNLHIKKMERCNFLPNTVLEEAGAPQHGIFAVITALDLDLQSGPWPVRRYPWGTAECMSSHHSDLLSLKRLLFETAPGPTKLATEEAYTHFRPGVERRRATRHLLELVATCFLSIFTLCLFMYLIFLGCDCIGSYLPTPGHNTAAPAFPPGTHLQAKVDQMLASEPGPGGWGVPREVLEGAKTIVADGQQHKKPWVKDDRARVQAYQTVINYLLDTSLHQGANDKASPPSVSAPAPDSPKPAECSFLEVADTDDFYDEPTDTSYHLDRAGLEAVAAARPGSKEHTVPADTLYHLDRAGLEAVAEGRHGVWERRQAAPEDGWAPQDTDEPPQQSRKARRRHRRSKRRQRDAARHSQGSRDEAGKGMDQEEEQSLFEDLHKHAEKLRARLLDPEANKKAFRRLEHGAQKVGKSFASAWGHINGKRLLRQLIVGRAWQ